MILHTESLNILQKYQDILHHLMIIYDVVNIFSMKNYKSSKKIEGGPELVVMVDQFTPGYQFTPTLNFLEYL